MTYLRKSPQTFKCSKHDLKTKSLCVKSYSFEKMGNELENYHKKLIWSLYMFTRNRHVEIYLLRYKAIVKFRVLVA